MHVFARSLVGKPLVEVDSSSWRSSFWSRALTRRYPTGDLAAIAQLSPSAFHRQFKAVTAMTPLQQQKQLRLLEARRLMIAGAANAETPRFESVMKVPPNSAVSTDARSACLPDAT